MVRSLAREKPHANAASQEDQPPSNETPGNSFSCESLLSEIRSASSNELLYNKELWDQRFNRARHLCFQLVNTPRSTVAHLEILNRLNELIHACVTHSDFYRSQLGNMPNSNNIKLLVDKHDQEVQEIQKLKSLFQNISNCTEEHSSSRLPTTAQTTTFVKNIQAGMSVRYERAKNPKESAGTQAGTPAGNQKGSKGHKGGQEKGNSILKNSQSTSQQGSGSGPQRPAENQQQQQGKTQHSPGRGKGNKNQK